MPQDFDFNKLYIAQTTDIIQALLNLNHLICEAAEDPHAVRIFSNLVEGRLQAITRLLVDPNKPEVRTAAFSWKC